MKKLLLSLLGTLILGTLSMFAENVTVSSFKTVSGNLDDNISYTTGKGGGTSNPKVNNGEIRLYQTGSGQKSGGYITITAKEGYRINSIVIGSSMATTVKYQVDNDAEVTDKSIGANDKLSVTTLSATSLTFTCMGTTSSARFYVNYISVDYTADGPITVATPIISNVYGKVTLNCDTKGATIKYNVGDAAVDAAACTETYSEPFSVTNGQYVSAYAIKDGATASEVTSKQISWEVLPCGDVVFTPESGSEITAGSTITATAENAVKYAYAFGDAEATEVEGSMLTIDAPAEAGSYTLNVTPYNVDGEAGTTATATYTVVVPTSASVDLMFECDQSTGNQISGTNMTKTDYMIASKSQSLVASLSGASNLFGGVNKSVRFGSYSNESYKQGALTITLKEAYKITSIDVTITTFKSTNNKAPKNPTWNLNINGHQMVETLTSDVKTATTYNIPFETVALADESAANTLTIKSTNAPVDVYSLKINYEPTSTGVNDIIADDANAPVEYYNLQGVRVANPESGLYIRVQGKKASKVLVK